jgi:hypothetical protein
MMNSAMPGSSAAVCQRHSLALASGEEIHAILHPAFKAEIECCNTLAEILAALAGQRGREAACLTAGVGERQVFLDRQRAAGAGERILEDAGNEAGTRGGRLARDVGGADRDLA